MNKEEGDGMKLVGLDDNSLQLSQLQNALAMSCRRNQEPLEFKGYQGGDALMLDYEDGLDADAYFLDIQMKGTNGMQCAREIHQKDPKALIVFITAIKDYVFEGYDVDALGYILKPYEQDQIDRMLAKVRRRLAQQRRSIVFHTDEGERRFAADECWYIESSRHDSILHTKAEEVTLRSSLSELEKQLQPEGFFATHRCYLVNLKAVEQVTREACMLPDHHPVPIARGNYEKVMQAFIAANRS